jgi:Ca-activated chloride channel homolog
MQHLGESMPAIAVLAKFGRRSASQPAREIDSKNYVLSALFLTCLCFCCVTSSPAQISNVTNYASIIDSPISTLRKQVEEVNLLVTVTNKRGEVVDGLGQGDLTILDNDEPPQRITYFQSQTDLPLRVAVVVDSSDSVTNRFRFEVNAASIFLREILRPSSDMALVESFNQDVKLVQPLTANTDLLTRGLNTLQPKGETSIYDAVLRTCKELSHARDTQPLRRAIILITDGEDNRSHIGLSDAVEAALRAETTIYVLSTNPKDGSSWAQQGDKAMKNLADSTGGHLLRTDQDKRVSAAFRKLEVELRTQYAIGYKPPSSTPDGLFHKLKVLGPKKLRIFHRQGYFAR